jgi:uncharacterized delta-60 repeat protein
MNRILKNTFLILAGCFHIFAANSQSIELDTTFGNGGRVITDFGAFDIAFGVAVQSDGKILVCGTTTTTPTDALVLRYLTNGDLDTTFGEGGQARISLGNYTTTAYAITIHTDDKILIAGFTSDLDNDGDMFLAKFNQDGSPDSSFGINGGRRIFSTGWDDKSWAIAVQPSGKIIVTGHQNENIAAFLTVFRFDAFGNLDNSFGTNGRFTYPNASSGISIGVKSNGDFVIAGQKPGDETSVVLYFMEDGSLSSSFGINGVAELDLILGPDKIERVWSSFFNADGTITLGGNFYGFSAARILSNGMLDPSFGVGGVANAVFPTNEYVLVQGSSCIAQPDGKILVCGLLIDLTDDDFGIVRFDKSGNLDTSFGNEGWVATNMTGTQDWCYGSALQADNKLLLGGYSLGNQKIDILLARYYLEIESGPPPSDTSITEAKVLRLFPNPSSGMFTIEYSIGSKSKISADIVDAAGRLVRTLFLGEDGNAGINTKPIDISDVADGFYILKFITEYDQFFFPIIKHQ